MGTAVVVEASTDIAAGGSMDSGSCNEAVFLRLTAIVSRVGFVCL